MYTVKQYFDLAIARKTLATIISQLNTQIISAFQDQITKIFAPHKLVKSFNQSTQLSINSTMIHKFIKMTNTYGI